jgi:DHA2 family multidrug resistance protein-like MFS transporter
MEGVISYLGRQDNVAVRQAAFVALAINLLMVVAAIGSIMLTIPARKRETGRVEVAATRATGPARP